MVNENSEIVSQADNKQSGAQGLPRLATVLVGLAAALLVLVLMSRYASIIGPILLALNLMVTAYPIHSWLTRRGVPSWMAACATMFTVYAVLLAMVAGLIWSVAEMINVLPNYADQWNSLYNQLLNWAGQLGFDSSQLASLLRMVDPNSVIGAASSVFSGASGFVGMFVVIVMAVFFMAMDSPGLHGRFKKIRKVRPNAAFALNQFATGVRRYWLVTTIFGLIVAVLDGIALQIMDVPLVMVWVLFSFLTNYIPNIGFVIGVIPPALVALFANSWQTSVAVIIAYCVLNFVVQSLIQPRFTGESVGVTTTVSFLSLLLWSAVLGGLGSLLALPMTLLVKALLIDIDPKSRWVGYIISSKPDSDSSE
ncbi:AI-2E family transporter [Propionimicrobium lymphophilum]|uniref:AI-2E family transporter n=1 Tax=Propionimicrobium lymphophilum ACS-093-V-SCH5 TaxID=883161 RepID=S2WW66_9ACTN|nr:AI-2E family transporter [Propionimicrobium lymphophilum]EPD31969.1 hypothetical protein HMPREF9306_01527 [Propionimicrobium lymphophilum ACS-093-V-SCH5]ETJ97804.1 PF01594 domain protein [Propionimicrobium sp. BV2F7]MDK7709187.1 AI-2E family transporter [Propionimicrobium lymphophilum]MDK7733175.1 AI-2E family transporter [Propionimicrobium lymphophilum]